MPAIVVGDLVGQDERDAFIRRQALEQAARDVDVPPGEGERIAPRQPEDHRLDRLTVGAFGVEPSHDARDAFGRPRLRLVGVFAHELTVQPLRELEPRIEVLRVIRGHGDRAAGRRACSARARRTRTAP
jgi:hypothetical protein